MVGVIFTEAEAKAEAAEVRYSESEFSFILFTIHRHEIF